MRALALALVPAALLAANAAFALDADPSNYTTVLPTLQPGDTLNLAAGSYPSQLNVTSLNGTAAKPIVIRGPAGGGAVFVGNGCCNTVEITNSSFVSIENLTIDSGHIDGVFGVSAKDDINNLATHDITIQGCTFTGQDGSQQTDGISTKTPTWNWIIRGNVIRGAGTGLYLGNSNGNDPFVHGIIEGNLVEDTIGYNMEIKFQNPYPNVPGLPTGAARTIIRNNVFIKNDDPSPDGDRPNILVGGFPASGAGAQNLYEIYGNFFFHNPRESLIQASGRVSIHDNVFVDASDKAVYLADQDLPLELAHVYDNTIYSAQRGIHFGNAAPEGDLVFANLVFATTAIDGPIANGTQNLTDTVANAGMYVANPSLVLGQMDFYPKTGKCQGAAFDASAVASEDDYAVDFNGTPRGAFEFRGAYAGDGQNPGWQLQDGLKQGGAMGSGGAGGGAMGSGGGSGGSSASGQGGRSSASSSGEGGGGANGDDGGSSGCGCRIGGDDGSNTGAWALWAAALAATRRRRSQWSGRTSAGSTGLGKIPIRS